MSVRISRRLVLAAVITAALPLSACKDKDDDKKKKDDDDEEEEEEEEEEDEDPMAGATYKTVPSTKVQVPIPKGWATKKKSLYSVASAPDGKAFLASRPSPVGANSSAASNTWARPSRSRTTRRARSPRLTSVPTN